MFLSLSGHSCPYIAHSLNCCAQFTFNPWLTHEKALTRIGRYLKALRDKGLMLKPSGLIKVDAYPDADFSRLYGHDKTMDPACVKS
ncbi:hypothetical protein ACHAW6_012401 [Cyclotella cf. meneghiniana]